MTNGPPPPAPATALPSTTSHRPMTKTTFHLAAGLASGFTSAVLLQPADLLKTRVQQSRGSTLLQTLRGILRSPQPIQQLWRGTLASSIRTSVGSALYFTTLNALRTHLAATSALGVTNSKSSALPRLSPGLNLACGAFARASVGFLMMPITVIKVRYESSLYASYRSLGGAAAAIWRAEGLRGFFAGSGATAIRDAPYAGLYVLFYESGKRVLGELVSAGGQQLEGSTPAAVNFVSGAAAAAAATAATNPTDVIKTRLQLRPEKYRNTLQAARLMVVEEGVRSFFDGLGLRVARKAMSSALAWTLYEEVVRRAEKKFVA